MLERLIGRSSIVGTLKEGLDASMQRAQRIAHRVANASTPGGPDFEAALNGPAAEGVDLETEMVALADEQIRYDATARLLQRVYEQIRASVKER